MKKLLTSLLIVAVSVCAVGAFASCGEEKGGETTASVIENNESVFAFQADKSADGTKSVYDYLSDFASDGVMTFDGDESEYGFFVTAVNGVKQADDYSSYWALYTSIGTVDGVVYATPDYGTYELNGLALNSASYGVSALPVFAEETYALVYTSFGSFDEPESNVIENSETAFAFVAEESEDGTRSLYECLQEFASEGIMTFEGYDSEYGFFITAVNGVKQADDYSSFWGVYTSIGTIDGVVYATSDYGTHELNGSELNSASYGVSSLPVFGGEIYALVYTTYTYSD